MDQKTIEEERRFPALALLFGSRAGGRAECRKVEREIA